MQKHLFTHFNMWLFSLLLLLTQTTWAQTGEVYGLVFHDENVNGNYEIGEPLIEQAAVVLNGADSLSTVTDEYGIYHYSNLITDNQGYTITVAPPSNYNKLINYTAYINTNKTAERSDIALYTDEQLLTLGSISGHIWEDHNVNRKYDGDKESDNFAWIPIEIIHLKRTSGLWAYDTDTLETIFTDENGYFELDSLVYGEYLVQVLQLPFEGLSGVEYFNYFLRPGEDHYTTELELQTNDRYLGSTDIIGYCWYDKNANGTFDSHEQAMYEVDMACTLLNCEGANYNNISLNTFTDEDGRYGFYYMPFTTYTLDITTPEDYFLSDLNVATDTLGYCEAYSEDIKANFPLVKAEGVVYGIAYHDQNRNGRFDPIDIPLSDAIIQLEGANEKTFTTITNDNGVYIFDSIWNGVYEIKTPDLVEEYAVFPENGDPFLVMEDSIYMDIPAYTIEEANQWKGTIIGQVWYDINHNRQIDTNEPPAESPVFVVTAAGDTITATPDVEGYYSLEQVPYGEYTIQAVDIPENYQADFVIVDLLPGQTKINIDLPISASDDYDQFTHIFGYVWQDDLHPDQQKNGAEPVYADALISISRITDDLYPVVSDTVYQYTTNSAGFYQAAYLPSGSYQIAINLPPGLDSPNPIRTFLPMEAGTNNQAVNFPLYESADGHFPKLGSISGQVWLDENQNGIRDGGETGLEGIKVFDKLTQSVITDENGSFSFHHLIDGDYFVRLPFRSGYSLTTPTNYEVTIIDNADLSNVSFGLVVKENCDNNQAFSYCTDNASAITFCQESCLVGNYQLLPTNLQGGILTQTGLKCLTYTPQNDFVGIDSTTAYYCNGWECEAFTLKFDVQESACTYPSVCEVQDIYVCPEDLAYPFSICPEFCDTVWSIDPIIPSLYWDGTCLNYNPDDGTTLFDSNITFNVCQEDSIDCSQIELNFVLEDCEAIWPGDINQDGVVLMDDLLQLGISYGMVGPARWHQSNSWYPQLANMPWAIEFLDGVDYRYADCNGDGICSEADTTAIQLNYRQVHGKTGGITSTTGAPVFFEFPDESFQAGDTLNIPVYLGNDLIQVAAIYGLAFTIEYDASLVVSGTVKINFRTNTWLGSEEMSLNLQKNFHESGLLDVGFTRINHINTSGHGAIADVQLVLIADIIGKDEIVGGEVDFPLSITNTTAITALEQTVEISGESRVGRIVVGRKPLVDIAPTIKCYPNPTKERLYITAEDQLIEAYTLFNLYGQPILSTQNLQVTKVDLALPQLPAGIYWIDITTTIGQVRKEVVIH